MSQKQAKPDEKKTAVRRAHTQQTTPQQADSHADLQRTLGNRALGRLVSKRSSVNGEQSAVNGPQPPAPIPQPLMIQPKLTVNAVGDKYEQEADAVAREAMKKLQNTNSVPTTSIQRQELREEENLRRKNTDVGTTATTTSVPSNSNTNLEVAKTTLYKGGAIPHVISTKIQYEKGNGQPLPNDFREKIESILGYDFSNVRIHASHQAHHLNNLLAARAFTVGRDIFFKFGEYNPFTSTGQELLAHELAHVIQQLSGTIQSIQRDDDPDWLNEAEKYNSGVAATTGTIDMAATASLWGHLMQGTDSIADFAAETGGTSLAKMSSELGKFQSTGGKLLGGVGQATGLMSFGKGFYDLTSGMLRGSTEDMIQGGSDILASGTGLVGGLYGKALSTGYSIGQFLDGLAEDKLGQKLSDRLAEHYYEENYGSVPRQQYRGLR